MLMEFCQDAQFKLEAIPSSTVEYVKSLTFLDTIQEKVSIHKLFCEKKENSFELHSFDTSGEHSVFNLPFYDSVHFT